MGETPALPDETNVTTPVGEDQTVETTAGVSGTSASGQASTIPAAQKSSETPPETWEKKAAFAFGVAFLLMMIGIAIFIKDPTPFQYTFFRVAMSLAAAGVGAVIPGLIQLEVNQKYLPLIRAGGAIALFVLVYLFNPPKL